MTPRRGLTDAEIKGRMASGGVLFVRYEQQLLVGEITGCAMEAGGGAGPTCIWGVRDRCGLTNYCRAADLEWADADAIALLKGR